MLSQQAPEVSTFFMLNSIPACLKHLPMKSSPNNICNSENRSAAKTENIKKGIVDEYWL
jgi:hypothetical protein